MNNTKRDKKMRYPSQFKIYSKSYQVIFLRLLSNSLKLFGLLCVAEREQGEVVVLFCTITESLYVSLEGLDDIV